MGWNIAIVKKTITKTKKSANAEPKLGFIYLIGKIQEKIKHFLKKINNPTVINLGTKFIRLTAVSKRTSSYH